MKKGERKISLMGMSCSLYCNEKRKWVIVAPLAVREQFNKFLFQLLDDDMISCSQTGGRAHVETRFTNINDLMKKLRRSKPISV